MANVARARAELKRKYNDPERNFKALLREFKSNVSNAGIMHDYKDHAFFESKSERKRKKRKESQKKQQMELLERKLLGGERVKAPAGLIKKVLSNLAKEGRKGGRTQDE